MATPEVVLDSVAATLDPAWLVAQRWFRAKRRTVASVAPHDLATLDGGTAWLLVVGVSYEDGGMDRYLVPLVAGREDVHEPEDGEGAWRALAQGILGGQELPGRRGTFVMEASTAAEALVPGGPASLDARSERRLRVEQSNTSAVLDERLMLKLYRLLEPGANPDTEIGTFLTNAGFTHTPRVAGAVTYLPDDGASCAVAMLGEYVASRGDGWAWALGRLADAPAAPEVLEGIASIGALTGELHRTLASRPGDAAFPARPATLAELSSWRRGAEQQLAAALDAVEGRERERLDRVAPTIGGQIASLEDADAPPVSRIHGDYHLGQLLDTPDGFLVIDFEGEPARSLAERRQPSSPLRDVAGMLRSFDYAARTAERAGASGLDPDAWLAAARQAFLSAYGGLSPGELALLSAFEVEKACYEVRYEANNRPDWTWLPIGALERLAA